MQQNCGFQLPVLSEDRVQCLVKLRKPIDVRHQVQIGELDANQFFELVVLELFV